MFFKSWKKRNDAKVHYEENRGDCPGFIMLKLVTTILKNKEKVTDASCEHK